MTDARPLLAGSLNKYGFGQADKVWEMGGCSPTILAYNQGQIGHQIQVAVRREVRDDDEMDEATGRHVRPRT